MSRSFNTAQAPAFGDVREWVEREQVSLRDASYLVAVERVAHPGHERGWV